MCPVLQLYMAAWVYRHIDDERTDAEKPNLPIRLHAGGGYDFLNVIDVQYDTPAHIYKYIVKWSMAHNVVCADKFLALSTDISMVKYFVFKGRHPIHQRLL